jgi:hypothetical protein
MAQTLATATINVESEKPYVSVRNLPVAALGLPKAAATALNKTPTKTVDEGVRVLCLHEYKQAAATLAEAFKDDESSWYFLDTPDREHWSREQKWNLHVQIFEYIVYAHLMKGLVLGSGPNYECVACW